MEERIWLKKKKNGMKKKSMAAPQFIAAWRGLVTYNGVCRVLLKINKEGRKNA